MTIPPLKAVIVPVTSFQQNCSIVWCPGTMRGAIVDPGGDVERIAAAVAAQAIAIEKILLTHGHLDHAGAAQRLSQNYAVPIEGPHPDDRFLLDALAEHGGQYKMACEPCRPDRWLADGDTVEIGGTRLGVRHCPGHTPGHVVFHQAEMKIAFVGDVLFKGSIGRSDFPRGNHADLIRSITERLWPLGDETRFVPGHGQMSTFGWERKTNPYVSDLALGRA
ncbi:MAG TPA: MBL fold metallo-hydrolase [Rhizomicrobium sp.]|jgi:glyoxylase-like metal-dependent hydrolase (beta-lactamase superfamily II)